MQNNASIIVPAFALVTLCFLHYKITNNIDGNTKNITFLSNVGNCYLNY